MQKASLTMVDPEIVAISTRSDEAVTAKPKWKIDMVEHMNHVIDNTSIPLQDCLEALVFTTFVYALNGKKIGNQEWFDKVLIVAVGLTATDLLAPAMASATRLSLALVFYSKEL
jgi:hypothetical protein